MFNLSWLNLSSKEFIECLVVTQGVDHVLSSHFVDFAEYCVNRYSQNFGDVQIHHISSSL